MPSCVIEYLTMISFTLFQLVMIAVIILLIGILANIAGFGGAIFVIPLLHVVFGLPLKVVIGSSLAAIAIPAFIGFISSWRRGEVDFTAGIMLEIPTMVGVFIGTSLVRLLNDEIIIITFGLIALFVSYYMIRKIIRSRKEVDVEMQSPFWERLTKLKPWFRIDKETYSYRLSIPLMIVAGLCIGTLSGLLGVGGGWLKTPLLIFGIGLPPIIASGTALFMLTLTAVTGGILHYLSGNWDFNLFIVVGVSLSLGAIIGDYIKQRIQGYFISIVISLSLGLVALIMLFQAVSGVV